MTSVRPECMCTCKASNVLLSAQHEDRYCQLPLLIKRMQGPRVVLLVGHQALCGTRCVCCLAFCLKTASPLQKWLYQVFCGSSSVVPCVRREVVCSI